jgi:Uma2 family endonuclease
MSARVTTHTSPVPAPRRTDRPPPLHDGDRLTKPEFRRRYEAMTDLKKAELVQGVVYMGSPVSTRDHASPHGRIVTWIGTYVAFTPGTDLGDNGTLRGLDAPNEPQPDVHLRILPECGGQSRMDENGYVVGPPELAVEVAASSASYDLHDKLEAYRNNGVREYVVWRTWDDRVDWYILNDGQFVQLSPGPDGIHRSETFPGLWLDAAALIRWDLAGVLQVANRGIASPEHVAFVEQLRQRARTAP